MLDIPDFPSALREAGFVDPGGEYAWDAEAAIPVAQWLTEHGQAVLGGDALGWRADDSVCETMTSTDPERRLIAGWDVRGRDTGEEWPTYCLSCLDSAVMSLTDPVSPDDVAEDVVAVRYRLTWRNGLDASGPEPLPGNPAARYWG